jgi:hypothetical protein
MSKEDAKDKKEKENQKKKKIVRHYFYYVKPNGSFGLKNRFEEVE